MASLNVANFVNLKLTSSNYPLWREQAISLAESQDLITHILNENYAPPKHTQSSSNASEEAPALSDEFIAWRKSDRLLRGWLLRTLSEEALSRVVGTETAFGVWKALQDAYAIKSKEREFTLKHRLSSLRKSDDASIEEHLRAFKNLCDSLAAIGSGPSDDEKAFTLLNSLGPKYEIFTTAMFKPPMPAYSDLVSQLQGFDQRKSWFADQTPNTFPAHLAFIGQKSNKNSGNISPSTKFTSHGRGFQAQAPRRTNNSPRPTPPGKQRMTPHERELYKNEVCQYCNVQGHIQQICWWAPDQQNRVHQGDIPQALNTLTLDNSVGEEGVGC